MRFYYLVGRAIRPIVLVLFFAYNRIIKQSRVRVVSFNAKGEILLVQNWTGHKGWSLPGGGVNRGESAKSAAIRELHEETGIVISASALQYIDTLHENGYESPVFVAILPNTTVKTTYNKWEIAKIGWFLPQNLPPQTTLFVQKALSKISEKSPNLL